MKPLFVPLFSFVFPQFCVKKANLKDLILPSAKINSPNYKIFCNLPPKSVLKQVCFLLHVKIISGDKLILLVQPIRVLKINDYHQM